LTGAGGGGVAARTGVGGVIACGGAGGLGAGGSGTVNVGRGEDCGTIRRGAGGGATGALGAGGAFAAGVGDASAAAGLVSTSRGAEGGAGGAVGTDGAEGACCRARIAFRTSPGFDMWERSILVLKSSSARLERALALLADDSARDWKWARTFSAS
jgi:hypothetical protein